VTQEHEVDGDQGAGDHQADDDVFSILELKGKDIST
jgi:hypothetical protein